MKKIFLIITAVCVALSLAPAVLAASSDVVDNAGVLTRGEISDLSDAADSICEEYGISVVILTETYLSGSTYDMADDHFYYGGYGDDGILFLLVMESRDWEIATYGEAAGLISDSKTEELFRAARNDLADDNYYDGFSAYLDALDEHLAHSSGKGKDNSVAVKILISAAVGLVAALITLLVMRGKMNTVRPQRAATNYMCPGSYSLSRQRDLFLYSNTTRTRRSQNNGSSGGSGGGGGSRGGSRGKF